MLRKYGVFEFWTEHRLSKNRRKCNGMEAVDSGEITAAVTDMGTSHREEFKLNISDKTGSFPLTVEDKIILVARRAIKAVKKKT